MFYPNANNSRSFSFYHYNFFYIILLSTSDIRKPQIISGGGRYAPTVPFPSLPLTTPLLQQHNKTVI